MRPRHFVLLSIFIFFAGIALRPFFAFSQAETAGNADASQEVKILNNRLPKELEHREALSQAHKMVIYPT